MKVRCRKTQKSNKWGKGSDKLSGIREILFWRIL
jgi:hypothetical protein